MKITRIKEWSKSYMAFHVGILISEYRSLAFDRGCGFLTESSVIISGGRCATVRSKIDNHQLKPNAKRC